VVPEAPFQDTGIGIRANGEGWFVVNARESPWREIEGRGAAMSFEGATDFPQVGVNLFVVGPGEPMAMYHWEADQEDYLVLSGEALLIVEGQERPLRQWDFVHCPARAPHVIVGAGDGPCALLAIGAREHQAGDDWGGYPVDEVAQKHGAGVEEETTKASEAYARFPEMTFTAYREGWLPGD
jgi:uncharacterized cupin superfamily protein